MRLVDKVGGDLDGLSQLRALIGRRAVRFMQQRNRWSPGTGLDVSDPLREDTSRNHECQLVKLDVKV